MMVNLSVEKNTTLIEGQYLHPYRVLIIGGSNSGNTNALLNLIKDQKPDTYKIYLCVKDLIKGTEKIVIKNVKKLKDIH